MDYKTLNKEYIQQVDALKEKFIYASENFPYMLELLRIKLSMEDISKEHVAFMSLAESLVNSMLSSEEVEQFLQQGK